MRYAMASTAIHRKKNGTAYVYSVESYWDKEKKAPRNKQVCLGRLNGTTGEIICLVLFFPFHLTSSCSSCDFCTFGAIFYWFPPNTPSKTTSPFHPFRNLKPH